MLQLSGFKFSESFAEMMFTLADCNDDGYVVLRWSGELSYCCLQSCPTRRSGTIDSSCTD